MIVGDLIDRNARLHGTRPALVFEGRRFTHGEFQARVHRAANAFAKLGLRRQERVAILAKNCNAYLEVFGAGEVAGYITVNLNHRLSERELAEICRDCEPAILVYSEEFGAAGAHLATLPSVRHAICIEGPQAGAQGYEALLAASDEAPPAARAVAEDTVYLIYTSGSTGRPKGVMWGHTGMLEAARTLSHDTGMRADDMSLIVMPLFHIGAKIEHMVFTYLGGGVAMHRQFELEDALASIQAEKITTAHLAPLMIQRILDAPNLADYDLSSLRSVHYASAPMPVPLLRRALARFGPIFLQVYGMTECLGGTILKPEQHRPDGSPAEVKRLGSAGQPFYSTDIVIADADDAPCPPGGIGEVLIRTKATMQGYWSNSAATIDALRGGWMHTMDLGYADADGFIYIVDRKRDMIISGGENIYSWEVEEALRTHPAVAEVAVIGVPDPQWGEGVKACVVLAAGKSATAAELIAHCRDRLASYKKPRSVDFLDALPRLFNGKIDKKALRAPHWSGRDRQVA
ncbi:MAG: AMP-binding protein [Rhodospirillaceae bacterium]|nr:AMP-binding protein [Rhodospirillaceae bacterium]